MADGPLVDVGILFVIVVTATLTNGKIYIIIIIIIQLDECKWKQWKQKVVNWVELLTVQKTTCMTAQFCLQCIILEQLLGWKIHFRPKAHQSWLVVTLRLSDVKDALVTSWLISLQLELAVKLDQPKCKHMILRWNFWKYSCIVTLCAFFLSLPSSQNIVCWALEATF